MFSDSVYTLNELAVIAKVVAGAIKALAKRPPEHIVVITVMLISVFGIYKASDLKVAILIAAFAGIVIGMYFAWSLASGAQRERAAQAKLDREARSGRVPRDRYKAKRKTGAAKLKEETHPVKALAPPPHSSLPAGKELDSTLDAHQARDAETEPDRRL